jgi:shikimate dehydrogenase
MHRAAISFSGLQGTYELIDCPPAQLGQLMPRLRSAFNGFNVTVPHKTSIMHFLDDFTDEALKVQAVNTVRVERSGRMIGHNTDSAGFINALKKRMEKSEVRFPCVCLVGAGGAARAALWALAEAGTQQLVIVARTQREARMMRDEFTRGSNKPMQIIMRSPGEPLNTSAPALIVNCTPIGLSGEEPPDWFVQIMQNSRRGAHIPVFFDMVYARGPLSTPLVRTAANLGLIASDGLQMLIEQAALSFEFWTGVRVPTAVMEQAVAAEQASGC